MCWGRAPLRQRLVREFGIRGATPLSSRHDSKPAPPATASATGPRNAWYVVATSRQLRKRPLQVRLFDTPLVLFRRPDASPCALLDRCSHRNVPLSLGKIVGQHIECAYHGWRFDGEGQCRVVPGLCKAHNTRGRRIPRYCCREQDGMIWVYAEADRQPSNQPYALPFIGTPGYTTLRYQVDAHAGILPTAENALDVPHTAFLHGGLFRSQSTRNTIRVEVRRWHDRVEAEYLDEPRPTGLAGRILAPGGGVVQHVDRFLLPSIVQVDYRLGQKSHFCVTAALSPLSDSHTRLFAVITFRLPFPGWLVKPLLKPVALRIFKQDAQILAAQTQAKQDFGGEHYASTEIDVLGSHILLLLRHAQRGPLEAVEQPAIRRLTLSA